MSDDEEPTADDDGSALDDVSEEEVEELEEDVDTEDLDEDELITLDDAARALLAKPSGATARSPASTAARRASTSWASGASGSPSRRLIIVLGIVSIILRGGLNLGIEFKGGTEWTIAAPGVTQTQAADAMKGTGVVDPTVELLGSGSKQTLNVQSDLNKLSQANQNQVSQNVQNAMLDLTGDHAA